MTFTITVMALVVIVVLMVVMVMDVVVMMVDMMVGIFIMRTKGCVMRSDFMRATKGCVVPRCCTAELPCKIVEQSTIKILEPSPPILAAPLSSTATVTYGRRGDFRCLCN